MKPKSISSLQNPFIKNILQLQEKSRIRKKSKLFVIEGLREVSLALKGNYLIETLLFCEEIISLTQIESQLKIPKKTELIEISKEVYQKISHRKTTEGIVAVANSKTIGLNDLQLNKNSLILVAEAPEKPGNIGALLRTADAANLDAVIIANPKTDLYNPNIIRSSVGCIFTTQISTSTTNEIIEFLQQNQIQIFSAALAENSENYTSQNYIKPSAIVVGTEATGLSDEWLQNSTKKIIIPMQGEIDSLNVSVSAAIIIFEAKRQREKNS
ncbi:MAG: RNA methyltransferase [Bacteroidota bacterium]